MIRCGKEAIEQTYPRDYDKIYGDRAKQTGPLNHDLNGPVQLFQHRISSLLSPQRHAHDAVGLENRDVDHLRRGDAARQVQGSDRTRQSCNISDGYNIANLDDRKRRITLRNLLTMTAGLEWHEDLAYDDPKNSADVMEVDARLGALRDRPADGRRSRHKIRVQQRR